jgi:hypothetical protein
VHTKTNLNIVCNLPGFIENRQNCYVARKAVFNVYFLHWCFISWVFFLKCYKMVLATFVVSTFIEASSKLLVDEYNIKPSFCELMICLLRYFSI